MKKNLLVFILAVIIGVGVGVYMIGGSGSHGDSEAEFRAGEHYLILDKPMSVSNDTLVAISSYACPFCYNYHANVMPAIMDKIQARYEPFHMHAMGDYGVSASKILAVAKALDDKAGVLPNSPDSKYKKILEAYFDAYHNKKERWGNGADEAKFLQMGFEAGEISAEIYEKELTSAEVDKIFTLWDEGYEIAKISGVPAFVVGGKYLINIEKIHSAEQFANLINFLVSRQ